MKTKKQTPAKQERQLTPADTRESLLHELNFMTYLHNSNLDSIESSRLMEKSSQQSITALLDVLSRFIDNGTTFINSDTIEFIVASDHRRNYETISQN